MLVRGRAFGPVKQAGWGLTWGFIPLLVWGRAFGTVKQAAGNEFDNHLEELTI